MVEYKHQELTGQIINAAHTADNHSRVFEAQLLNYLKATDLPVGLIVNFGTSVQVKRMVLTMGRVLRESSFGVLFFGSISAISVHLWLIILLVNQ